MSVELPRSPFENVFNFLGGLPQGHEKALKHALYNALALLLLFICMACGWALYIVLGPFITPLLWASMCGSVLHPFKRSLSYRFSLWISAIEPPNSLLLWGLFITPINLINKVSELIGSTLVKNIKTLLLIIVSILVLHLMYSYTPHLCICIVWRIGKLIGALLTWFISCCSTSLVVAMIAAYLGMLAVIWQPEHSKKFELVSWPVWIVLSCYLANLFGNFQVPVFFSIQFVVIAGFLLQVWKFHNTSQASGKPISLYTALKLLWSGEYLQSTDVEPSENDFIMEEDEEKEDEVEREGEEGEGHVVESEGKDDVLDVAGRATDPEVVPATQHVLVDQARSTYNDRPTSVGISTTSLVPPLPAVSMFERRLYRLLQETHRSNVHPGEDNGCQTNLSRSGDYHRHMDSDKYFYAVLWACFAMLIFHHLWTLNLVPIPIFIYFVKHTGQYFGIWHLIAIQWETLNACLFKWYSPRQFAIFPVPVMCLSRVCFDLHVKIINSLKNAIDAIASVVVIFGVIIFIIGTSTFILVQVYAEGIHMVQVGASVVNSTVVSNSEFFSQLVPGDWYNNMDSMLGNAYTQGREGISSMVRSWLGDVDKVKADHLEKQVLDIWDRIYQSWLMAGTDQQFVGPIVQPTAIWENLVDGVQKSPELFNFDSLMDFGRANMDSLMSVLTTIWTISKGNISLLLTCVTTLLSVVFGGGTAVLNFLLSTVVFFTALFYLLSTSGDLYKPVEMITNFSPTYGNRFAVALEESFIGVFKASFKMAAFYGLWTWLIHNVFQMKIVYIPSVLASLLAAVPFLGTYWACIPAVLDLWLAQEKGLHAILLFLFQFLPTNVVDTTIYKEIHGGGHPYLTGLSIAGGIFCMGVQGAIIGPLLLCGLFVAINMSSKLLMDSPTDAKISQKITELSQQIQGARSRGKGWRPDRGLRYT